MKIKEEMIDQFQDAVLNMNLERALEIVKNPEFDPNQRVKGMRMVTSDNNIEEFERLEIEETPLHMVTDLDFEVDNILTEGELTQVSKDDFDTNIFEEILSQIVNVLIERGANINALDSRNHTPLFNAVQAFHLKTINILLKGGANSHIPNENNDQPLDIAIRERKHDIASLLLSDNHYLLITEETIERARDAESDDFVVMLSNYLIKQSRLKDEIINDLTGQIVNLQNPEKGVPTFNFI